MEVKSVESAIQNLITTVFGLQNKILSLEKTILSQNDVINKLISVSDNYHTIIEPGYGTCMSKVVKLPQQPMLEVRDASKPAVSLPPRKSNKGRQTSSECVVIAEPTRALTPSNDASESSDSSESPSTLYMHQGVSENSASAALDEWVNVKPRRSRRALDTSDSNNNAAVKKQVDMSRELRIGSSGTMTKHGRVNSISKGSNTSNLRIKAVERKKYFHIWRLSKDTTEDHLLEYIREILGEKSYIKVDKIILKTEREYSSFKICVSECDFETLFNSDIWPKNAEYCEWVFFRKTTNTHSTVK